MSPLKLFQYLASGRPVVSTRVAGVERFEELITVADGPDDFLSKIDEALRNDTPEMSRKRIEAARRETWDKRVKEMLEAVVETTGRNRVAT